MQGDIIRLVQELSAKVIVSGTPTNKELWPLLCKAGIHDYEFVVINQKGALLRCFYCEHEKISTQSWMKHLDKPREP